MALLCVFLIFVGFLTNPAEAKAFSIVSFVKSLFGISENEVIENNQVIPDPESKPFPFLSAIPVADPKAFEKNSELQFVDGTSLASSVGPLGNVAEAAESSISYKITTYVVRRGDSLPIIAKSFGVSVSTIMWANNIPRGGLIKEGETLVILPVSGVKHTVAKGDTIASIAKKYGSDPDDVVNFNDLNPNDRLAVGNEIVVPDGEISTPVVVTGSSGNSRPVVIRGGGPDLGGYYKQPVFGYIRTRGVHGFNGVDLAAPKGTPVYASASGSVIIARSSGWNGGYGQYVVISHPNGTQTLYGHLSSVSVNAGANISQGQQIGLVGNTGKSTGSHLHFEVRGAKNPF